MAEPPDWRRVCHNELASTQDEAAALWRSGTRGPTVVVAAKQTMGRGRHGRSWLSPEGGLYFSLLLPEAFVPEKNRSLLPLVAGLATVDAVSAHGAAALLKWPNDVLVDGRKLAGILCEGFSGACACGVGVNIVQAPLETSICLADLPGDRDLPAPSDLLDDWLAAFAARLARNDTVERVDGMLHGRFARAGIDGREVTILGVAESGALRVESDRGVEEIYGGEIALRN